MNLSEAELRDRRAALRNYKVPETDDKYVGVELEFSCPTPVDVLELRVIEANLDKHLSMGHDGGAHAGEYGYEWRVLVKQTEMEVVLKKVAKLISEAGGKYHPESGFHVHLDMRYRDPAKAFNNLVMVQDMLYAMADPRRAPGGASHNWCRPQAKPTLGEARKGKEAGINPHLASNKNSIEIRIRESCVDGYDIYNWVRFLCSVVDTSRVKLPIKSLGDLQKNVKMAKYTREYVKAKLMNNKKNDMLGIR